jgi:hypothetical protein
MSGLHRKSIKILVISMIALLVIAAVAIPAMAAGGGGPRPPVSPPLDGARIQGTATGGITVTPTGGTAVTLTLPADKMEAVYTVSGTTNTLKSLMVVMSKPKSTPTWTPTAITMNKVEGTASGSIIITPDSGTAVTLSMPADSVKADYTVSDSTNILRSLMVVCTPPATPTTSPTTTPSSGNRTFVEGLATGSLTVTPDSGTAVVLSMPSNNVRVEYTVSDSTYTLKSLRVIMSKSIDTPTGTPTAPNDTRIQGTASGAITVTPDSGTAVTLSMPSAKVDVVYSVSGATNTLIGINGEGHQDMMGGPPQNMGGGPQDNGGQGKGAPKGKPSGK